MADRPLGMAYVTDRQLRRLAASLPPTIIPADRLQARASQPVPVVDARDLAPEDMGMDATDLPIGAEAWLVRNGVRVARIQRTL